MASFLFDEDFSDWRSIYLKVFEVLTVLSGIMNFWLNVSGKPTTYSKFAEASRMKGKTIGSRKGMLLFYSPSGIASALIIVWKLSVGQSTGQYPSLRFWLTAGTFFVHFSKRVLEVLFVHRFSGVMELESSITISVYYLWTTCNVLLAQQLAEKMPPPSVDTTRIGLFLCVFGMAGNFYHHLILRNLRKNGSKKYVTPEGGLFSVFVAPHYVFEIIEFVGMILLCQTTFSVAQAAFAILYLVSRSYATKKLYQKKIDGFPSNRCVLVPGLI
ncbi:hypothetical protein R1flu_016723 [Riccia fluitans]|uniref:3-oxo-5-alpha-steroid 4-dehydrogenase C-terminal domain-containing protein n=1 Tax=Riccia fluitans TaxID=41844 RepID=A0ABD1YQP3_9MARC